MILFKYKKAISSSRKYDLHSLTLFCFGQKFPLRIFIIDEKQATKCFSVTFLDFVYNLFSHQYPFFLAIKQH